jgi:hypothetical protein
MIRSEKECVMETEFTEQKLKLVHLKACILLN